MVKKHRENIKHLEKLYPFIFSLLSFIIGFIYLNLVHISYTSAFDNVLNAVITFSSILVGFIGVLLGLLFSISNSPIVSKMFEKSEKYVLKNYFIDSIVSGILLVFFSIMLFLREYINTFINFQIINLSIYKCLFIFWCALIVYVLSST